MYSGFYGQVFLCSRVECGIFFVWAEQVKWPKVGMILEVPIQSFGACKRIKVVIFKTIPGGLDINNFCENWYKASFYNKEQT